MVKYENKEATNMSLEQKITRVLFRYAWKFSILTHKVLGSFISALDMKWSIDCENTC